MILTPIDVGQFVAGVALDQIDLCEVVNVGESKLTAAASSESVVEYNQDKLLRVHAHHPQHPLLRIYTIYRPDIDLQKVERVPWESSGEAELVEMFEIALPCLLDD